MKRALVHGNKICQIVSEGKDFDVAPPLKWVTVPDDTTTQDTFENGLVVKYSQPLATPANVKREAGQRILDAYPDWKQRNMNMRATELQEIRLEGGTLTAEQQAEADALKTAAAWITSVREASNLIEQDLGSMTISEMQADPRWP